MENDDLRAARGILNAILISVAFWVIVALLLWPARCIPGAG